MKKFCLFFALLLALGMTCALAEDYTSGGWKYILLEDGTAEITKYNGNAEELSIPAELDGHAVTSIGDDAFSGCFSLTSITVSPGSYAAQYCRDYNPYN